MPRLQSKFNRFIRLLKSTRGETLKSMKVLNLKTYCTESTPNMMNGKILICLSWERSDRKVKVVS